ncbi:FG-GAP-like repeat-containing protein [Thalassotalea atypica]|uniref:FG-GAP-like repeat-containing protein n=1 Tax=Thalassotalea atypica TaxID=2054316 RepID=UPI002572BC7E|nr:FG-GAP-like repeat-containing protein [Thalassotalea atypica]
MIIFTILFLHAMVMPPVLASVTWHETSFKDFSDGKLEASGHNLYVSHKGDIRTIHRFDINQDGYLDIMFNNTHDSIRYIAPTLTSFDNEGRINNISLAVQGSIRTEVSDLNKDGYQDLVFLPNESGVQASRRFITIIYGGEDGWSQRRSNGVLPVNKGKDVVIADLNGDSWPDIVTLNTPGWSYGQPSGGNIIRTYWGSEQGFILTRYQDTAVKGAKSLASYDFDEDDKAELLVTTSDNKLLLYQQKNEQKLVLVSEYEFELPNAHLTKAYVHDLNQDEKLDIIIGTDNNVLIFMAGSNKLTFKTAKKYDAFPASHISIDDLDADGTMDIVLTNFIQNHAAGGEATGAVGQKGAPIHILWGGEKWADNTALSLNVDNAVATAIADVNQDNHKDLAIAVHQGTIKYKTTSPFYYGRSNRTFVKSKKGAPTEGVTDIKQVRLTENSDTSFVYANSLGGSVGELVPLQLFWGAEKGFDENNQWVIPMRSGYESSAADFNADGYVDLLALNTGHAGEISKVDPTVGANIFWGSKQGFDTKEQRSVIHEKKRATSNVADFNRDGYLDIVLGVFDKKLPMSVHYGSAEGFPYDGGIDIKGSTGRSAEPMIADFNRDDWLDIVVPVYHENIVRFYHGSEQGFQQDSFKLDVPVPVGIDVADLNDDGYLDLVVTSYKDPITSNRDTGLFVFWGAKYGFKQWNSQWLPSTAPISPAIADFDNDGYLDIFAPNYHAELNRENLPNFIYWGSKDGFLATERTSLACDSGHDAQAGDFDLDGLLDIAVSCHASNGDHTTNSVVFYNDGQRFAAPKMKKLLTHGAHWMWSQDMGHIYNRGFQQSYQSSVFTWHESKSKGYLKYQASILNGAKLEFDIRSANELSQLESSPWLALKGDTFLVDETNRVLQYRARFISNNGDNFPILDSIKISLD